MWWSRAPRIGCGSVGCERLTGALLDRLTHRMHILEANGPSYRLRQSKHRLQKLESDAEHNGQIDPEASGSDDESEN